MHSEGITAWLAELRSGNPDAVDRLVPLLYNELRVMARGRMRQERGNHTLSTTGLVNEMYLRLRNQEQIGAGDRTDFLAAAGNTMRRILVDYARARLSQKRGGGLSQVPFEAVEPLLHDDDVEGLLELDDALSRLEEISPEGALVVQHRFFAGLTEEETAEALCLSVRTVQRRWFTARAWLRREMQESAG